MDSESQCCSSVFQSGFLKKISFPSLIEFPKGVICFLLRLSRNRTEINTSVTYFSLRSNFLKQKAVKWLHGAMWSCGAWCHSPGQNSGPFLCTIPSRDIMWSRPWETADLLGFCRARLNLLSGMQPCSTSLETVLYLMVRNKAFNPLLF